jgi:ectoine hydroxylase-related dioxygenase (phytanoyl-CoA dioxygenase family)
VEAKIAVPPDKLTFARDGAQLFKAALGRDQLMLLEAVLSRLPHDRAGLRLRGVEGLAPFLAPTGQVGRVAVSVLGNECQPVRAVLFDKTSDTNWALSWHQDRTIAVKERVLTDGFQNWSVKGGMLHVEPPIELLSRMVTLRLHIDPVPTGNAPLLIAPGSHRLGRVAEDEVREVIQRCGTVACLAEPGDVWLYATPILHASEGALTPTHRRVLQVDFSAEQLPGGLEWLGI